MVDPEIIILRSQKSGRTTRKRWLLNDDSLGTVEEAAREYYLNKRGYEHGIIDSSCLYGGIAWVVFHDIIFHDNFACRQPLRTDFYHRGQLGYARHRRKIEARLAKFRGDRPDIFDQLYEGFLAHPLFTNPRSKVSTWSGSWVKSHTDEVRIFLRTAPDHDIEELFRKGVLGST